MAEASEGRETRAEQHAEDRELHSVLDAQRRDADAFRVLVDTYERRLLYFILRFTNDAQDALDVLQDVWLTVYRRLPRLRAPAAFRVWLYQIAHDKAVSLIRSQRRHVEACEILWNKGDSQTADDEGFENAELVHRSLEALSVEHRAVLTLHFLEDMPLEGIAEVLRCPLGTVKSRLHYAKRALRVEVERRIHD